MVQLKPVTGSKQVKAYGYDATSGVLAVQFVNSPGVVYHYREVPADVAKAFDAAESKGSAMATMIRGKFDFNRIEVGEPADAEG